MSVALEIDDRLITAEDLLRLPDDGRRFELVRGRLIEMAPPPGAEHGWTTETLGARATVYVLDHALGGCFAAETGFLVERDPDTVLAPDWSFVRKERLPASWPKGYLPAAPDIVLETRSPDQSAREVADKIRLWLEVGVRVVWDLDPRRKRLTIHRPGLEPVTLGCDDTLVEEELLPGFSLPLEKVFP